MQKHKHARIFGASGSILILVGAAALIAARAYRSPDVGVSAVLALYLLGSVAIVAGVRLVQLGRKLVSLSADQATAADKRPPVLYLRPFGFDEVLSRTPEPTPHYKATTEEEQLVAAFSFVGPVVAIGEPGEDLPDLGAARAYVDDSDWQQRVSSLMRSAALTVILPGGSNGVRWEVSFALRNIQPSRLLVLVPAKLPLYADFLQHTSQDLPHALPCVEEVTSQSDFWINRFSSIRGMIQFDDDWRPRYRALRWQWKFWHTTRDQAPGVLVPAYRAALAPILSRLGLPEPKLIFSWYQLLGFIGIVGASIFFVYWNS